MAAEARQRSQSLRLAWRALIILLGAGFVALLAYGLIARSTNTTIDDGLAHGKTTTAPGFSLALLQPGDPGAVLGPKLKAAVSDGRVSLPELRGTPVVLNFWASWCDPCRTEAPRLERGWRAARARGVAYLGLNMQDLTDDSRGFLREFHIDYLNVRDPGNSIARRYGVTGLPETFFISAEGQVVGHVIGVVSEQQLRRRGGGRPGGAPRVGWP